MTINYSEYKYKIELHAHTKPVSGCADFSPKEVVRIYSDLGVDGIVITNHFLSELYNYKVNVVKFFMNDFLEAEEEGKRLGVKVYLGAEIRFDDRPDDYLAYGIDEKWLRRTAEYFDKGIGRYIKDFKNDPSLIIQAHPYRWGQTPTIGIDGAEAYNMHPYHNSHNDKACAHIAKHNLLATAGSDFHHSGTQGTGLMLTKTLPENSFELAEVIRNREYLFLIENKVVKPYI